MGLKHTGTREQIRRRINAKKRRARDKRRPRTKRRAHAKRRAHTKRRAHAQKRWTNLETLVGKTFRSKKGGVLHKIVRIKRSNPAYPIISINENGIRYKWSVKDVEKFLGRPTGITKKKKYKAQRKLSVGRHPLSQEIGAAAAWNIIKPTKFQERDEILSICGPQCFADADATFPICPRCDKMQCYCYPECGALKNAYELGLDSDTMIRYAQMMRCGWVPYHDNSLPPITTKKKKKDSGSRAKRLIELARHVPLLMGIQLDSVTMVALFTRTGDMWVLQTIDKDGYTQIDHDLTSAEVEEIVEAIPHKNIVKIQVTKLNGQTQIWYQKL